MQPRTRLGSFNFTILLSIPLCVTFVLRASAQSGTGPQLPAKSATLLVDTDDACHLFIDDVDKGVITPESSSKFSVTLGGHLLKCKNDSIPDLLWRKAVEVKDASQVVAVVSLKALHIQYDQAVTKAQNQKTEADSVAAKQLQEAELEEKQREEAKAEIPQKMFEMVKGNWHGSETIMLSHFTFQWDFQAVESGFIIAYYNFNNQEKLRFVLKPVPPNRLEATSVACITSRFGSVMKKGAPKDKDGWAECKNTDEKPIMGGTYIIIRGSSLTYHPDGQADIVFTR